MRGLTSRRIAPLCASAFLLALGPAPAWAIEKPKAGDEAGRYYFPNRDEAGERTVKPDEEIIRRPVVFASSAEVREAVHLQTSEGIAEIAAGTVLPAVKITNLPGQSGDVLAYCTAVVKAKPSTARFMLGSLGAKLVQSLTDRRKCLFDGDGDGFAEQTFLIDDGQPGDRTPRAIVPVALNISENRAAGPGDYVSLRLRKASRPSFIIDIVENGAPVAFDNLTADGEGEAKRQTLVKDATLPLDYELYGARFRILKFNKADGSITIEWLAGHADEMRSVPSKVVYTYRYY